MEEDLEKDMTPKLIGETWRKYPTETSKQKATYGLFECQYCGKEFETQVSSIHRGSTKSCGCRIGGKIKHGLRKNKFYNTWNGMMNRCYNTKSKKYKDYGGRGISVCEDWRDVVVFTTWCEETFIEEMTLDREDNDLGYNPENCRWTNKTIQALNQRMQKSNTSGYVGVSWNKSKGKWVAKIKVNKVAIHLGYFNSKEEAALAHDNYIIENNLPHKLSADY